MTPPVSDVINVTDVSVTYDHVTRPGGAGVQFEYVNNPVVASVRPLSSFRKYGLPVLPHS